MTTRARWTCDLDGAENRRSEGTMCLIRLSLGAEKFTTVRAGIVVGYSCLRPGDLEVVPPASPIIETFPMTSGGTSCRLKRKRPYCARVIANSRCTRVLAMYANTRNVPDMYANTRDVPDMYANHRVDENLWRARWALYIDYCRHVLLKILASELSHGSTKRLRLFESRRRFWLNRRFAEHSCGNDECEKFCEIAEHIRYCRSSIVYWIFFSVKRRVTISYRSLRSRL